MSNKHAVRELRSLEPMFGIFRTFLDFRLAAPRAEVGIYGQGVPVGRDDAGTPTTQDTRP